MVSIEYFRAAETLPMTSRHDSPSAMLQQLMDVIADIALDCDLTEADVLAATSDAFLNRQDQPTPDTTSIVPNDVAILSSVLSRWRTDEHYVAEDGSPRPIPPTGPSPSIASLIALVGASELDHWDPSSSHRLLDLLTSSDAVQRTGPGLYQPLLKHFQLNSSDRTAPITFLGHITEFARCVQRNVHSPGGKGNDHYIARVRRFPKHLIPQVKRMIIEDGLEFISTVDDYLESNRLPPESEEAAVHTGVGLYHFVEVDTD